MYLTLMKKNYGRNKKDDLNKLPVTLHLHGNKYVLIYVTVSYSKLTRIFLKMGNPILSYKKSTLGKQLIPIGHQ